MHATDILGYANTEYGGPVVCSRCATDDEREIWSPIFSGSETDSPTHCDRCEDLIPESLTRDGEMYVDESVQRHLEGMGGRACILRRWVDAYAYMFSDRPGLCALARTWPAVDEYSPINA